LQQTTAKPLAETTYPFFSKSNRKCLNKPSFRAKTA
jgi:hypothetical protein